MGKLLNGNVICNKCKLQAWSKCPRCRHTFPEYDWNQTDEQRACDHVFEYKPGNKCIYGCGYEVK